jgi:hypothetical protein
MVALTRFLNMSLAVSGLPLRKREIASSNKKLGPIQRSR